jgi:hypothetical protein
MEFQSVALISHKEFRLMFLRRIHDLEEDMSNFIEA